MDPKQEKRKCEICGNDLIKRKTESRKVFVKRRFCSKKCQSESRQNRETKNCLVCNKEMTFKKSQKRDFCSNKCKFDFSRKGHDPTIWTTEDEIDYLKHIGRWYDPRVSKKAEKKVMLENYIAAIKIRRKFPITLDPKEILNFAQREFDRCL